MTNGIKRLVSVEDYEEAWRSSDVGGWWITYQDDFDYLCAPGVTAFGDDIWDGGVGVSQTELHLSDFLYAIQPHDEEPDLTDMYEFANTMGIPVVEGEPIGPGDTAKDMLEHEPHLLNHPAAGPIWHRLRQENRLLYATFVFSLHREGWAKKRVEMASKLMRELEEAKIPIARLRCLRHVDPLAVERARDYKGTAPFVPPRLLRPLKALRELVASDSAISATARSPLNEQMHAYESFLAEYRRRRKQRFDEIADDDLRTAAGEHVRLLDDPRGQPSHRNLAERAVKAVFVSLTDEFINSYGVSERKAARLADRVALLLFGGVHGKSSVEPVGKDRARRALNMYRYAKKSRASV
jgi:hypothetical protein